MIEALLSAQSAKYHMFANSELGIVTMDPVFYRNLIKVFNLKSSLRVIRSRERFLNAESHLYVILPMLEEIYAISGMMFRLEVIHG